MNIIDKLVYALNKIPNQRGVGPNGESTYELLSKYGELKRNPDRTHLNEKGDKRFGSAASISFVVLHKDEEPTYEELQQAIVLKLLSIMANPSEVMDSLDLWDTMDIDA